IAADDPDYGALLTGVEAVGVRRELMREELGWDDNTPLAGTPRELVAEYAVGLHFTLFAAEPPLYQVVPVESDKVADFAGRSFNDSPRPDRLRSVRVRMAVRSSAPDRTEDIPTTDGVAPGRYRVKLQDNLYARVRTLQADIALRNQRNARW